MQRIVDDKREVWEKTVKPADQKGKKTTTTKKMQAEDLVRMCLLWIDSAFSSLNLLRQTEMHPRPCYRKVDRVQWAG